MSDQEKRPLPGEWWEDSEGNRWRVIPFTCGPFIESRRVMPLGTRITYYRMLEEIKLTRHLPGCTGWDWEEKNDG